jgi:hypothetical protein
MVDSQHGRFRICGGAMSSFLLAGDHRFLALLAKGQLERRVDGWRFGTRRIADHVVERLINSGRAVRDGDRVCLAPEAK